jgi:hypothetical protein
MLCRKIDNFPAKAKQHWSFQHHHAGRAGFDRRFESALGFCCRVHVTQFEALSARLSYNPQRRQCHGGKRRVPVQEHSDRAYAGGDVL